MYSSLALANQPTNTTKALPGSPFDPNQTTLYNTNATAQIDTLRVKGTVPRRCCLARSMAFLRRADSGADRLEYERGGWESGLEMPDNGEVLEAGG